MDDLCENTDHLKQFENVKPDHYKNEDGEEEIVDLNELTKFCEKEEVEVPMAEEEVTDETSEIFEKPQPPINKKVKKKKVISEKQRLHLKKMREKSLAVRKAKREAKEAKAKNKKVNTKVEKKVVFTDKSEDVEIEQKEHKTKNQGLDESFFNNMGMFFDAMERYENFKERRKQKRVKSEPIDIPKKNINIPKQPPKLKRQNAQENHKPTMFNITTDLIGNDYRNPFGF